VSDDLALHGVTWTEDGRPDGFLVGKAAALADWQHRRERAEFLKLTKVLSRRRTAAKERKDRPEVVRAREARWREAHRDYMRAKYRAHYARKVAGRAPKCCAICGAEVQNRKRTTCGAECKAEARRHVRRTGRNTTGLFARVAAILRRHPAGLTARAIWLQSPSLKLQSLRVMLLAYAKRGLLVGQRSGKANVYALRAA